MTRISADSSTFGEAAVHRTKCINAASDGLNREFDLGPSSLPLVVDLDGILTSTNVFHERFLHASSDAPCSLTSMLHELKKGPQFVDAAVQACGRLEPANLPYRKAILDLIQGECRAGRHVHLLIGKDDDIAMAVADHLGVLESVSGTSLIHDLRGAAKAQYLVDQFPDGFVYAGGSRADDEVFKQARGAVLVGRAVARRKIIEQAGGKVIAVIPEHAANIATWARMLRLHQWSKNLLIAVPMLLAQKFWDLNSLLAVIAGFVLFGMLASGTYVLNDLADIKSDRAHHTKRLRPLAAGTISIVHGLISAIILIATGLMAGFALCTGFGFTLLAYLSLTLGYTFWLKNCPLLDVFLIGVLFASRVVAGTQLADTPTSLWIVSFSISLFTSLALAKRYSELMRSAASGSELEGRRGYRLQDSSVVLAFGVTLAVSAVIIMLLYLQFDAGKTGLYNTLGWLDLVPMVLLSWVMRIWLFSQRGELDADPVVFALRDRASKFHALAVLVLWVLAVVNVAR